MSINRLTETRTAKQGGYIARRIAGVAFGAIEIILTLRLIFKLLGANPKNGFVRVLYSCTQFFVGIFEGIFPAVTAAGVEVKAVFETATLLAIVVVALVAWLVLRLMAPRAGTLTEKTEYTAHGDQGK
jgi:hypothetical protein